MFNLFVHVKCFLSSCIVVISVRVLNMTFSICSSTSFHLNILYFQGQPQGYNQQGFNQAPSSQSQYNNQGSIHQQPQPPGQPPGSSPQQQRPTPQPSPHQQVSPVPSPSPAHRLTPNPSPGPTRPQPQPSPGKQRTSQPSPSPSQRSSSSQQQSPPGSSPGQQHASQHNHLSSPKVRVFFCNNGYLERDGVLTSQLKKGGWGEYKDEHYILDFVQSLKG